MSDLKIGIIGAGGRGLLARESHNPSRGSVIAGAADIDSDTLSDLEKFCGNNIFKTDNYLELLERADIDAVFICSPDFLHEEHAVASLKAGKAVYMEKPMCITIEGCDRVLATAYETGSKLFIGHNMRYFVVVNTMKTIIDSGAIGNVQAIWCRHLINYGGDAFFRDWHSEQKFSNSLLLQKASHDIDVMHYLSGGMSKTVVGMGKLSVYNRCTDRRSPNKPGVAVWNENQWPPLEQKKLSPKIDVEDHSMLMMQFDNGVQASYVQCHYAPDHMRNYMVIGDAGRVENFNYEKVVVHNNRINSGTPDTVYNIKKLPGSHEGADSLIVQDFIEFVKHGKQPAVSPIAARYAIATGSLGAQSLRSDSSLRIIPDLPAYLVEYFDNGQKKD